jgi:hypothetical protein
MSTARASSSQSTKHSPSQRTPQFFHSTTNTLEIIQQNYGDELKHKIKSRRRRTSNQQQVQEEKDKPPGAEAGGEGQAITTINQ